MHNSYLSTSWGQTAAWQRMEIPAGDRGCPVHLPWPQSHWPFSLSTMVSTALLKGLWILWTWCETSHLYGPKQILLPPSLYPHLKNEENNCEFLPRVYYIPGTVLECQVFIDINSVNPYNKHCYYYYHFINEKVGTESLGNTPGPTRLM